MSKDDILVAIITCPNCGAKSTHAVTENPEAWGKPVSWDGGRLIVQEATD